MVSTSRPGRNEPRLPSSSRAQRLWAWLRSEAIDHLIPWNRRFLHQRIALQLAGIGLAVVVTASWILMAQGRLAPAVTIAWWIGWSVYEVLVRRQCKPWVKEGPWWGSQRRPASGFDLIAYVATKNLLIGAGLFLLLSLAGLLQPID
jgi:NosR/NirI family nitrous oxide reductase transcriptional regulator